MGFVKPSVVQVNFVEPEVAGAENTITNTPFSGEYVAFATRTLAGVKGEHETFEELSYDENRNPLIEMVLNWELKLRVLAINEKDTVARIRTPTTL